MHARRWFVFCLLAISTSASQAAFASDFCLELARRGLFDQYAGTIFTSSYLSSRDQYCSSYQKYLNSNTRLSGQYKGSALDFENGDNAKMATMQKLRNLFVPTNLTRKSSVSQKEYSLKYCLKMLSMQYERALTLRALKLT